MSAYHPGWRVRAYAGRSVDATEQTLLTPAAGAPHSDPFQYATCDRLRANGFDNPQLDTVLTGWARATGFGTLTRETAPPSLPFGVAVAKMVTSTDNTTEEGVVVNLVSGAHPPVTTGLAYVLSAFVDFTGFTGLNFKAVIRWYTSGDVQVGSDVNANFVTVAGWTRVSVSGTAPATAVKAELHVRENGTSATARTFYMTGAQLEQASALGRYNHSTAAYLGYLKPPGGRAITVDLLTRKLKGGSFPFTLQDKRTTAGGSNASRHVSAFLGDVKGAPLLLGLRWEADFCEDIDAAVPVWTRWTTGRVGEVSTDSGVRLTANVVDAARDLKAKLFQGRPHSSVTYAVEGQSWPLGRTGAYGPFLASTAIMRGTFVLNGTTGIGRIDLDSASQESASNVYTTGLAALGVPLPLQMDWNRCRFTTAAAVRVKQTSGGAAGTIAEYDLGGLQLAFHLGSAPYPLWKLYVRAKAGGSALPANGVSVEVSIRLPRLPVTKDAPLLLSDAHPVQRMQDACDGKFSLLTPAGAVQRTFPRDAAAFAALLADPSFGTLRSIETAPVPLDEFLARECLQSGLGWALNAKGEVTLFDLRFPTTTAGVATLGESDLVASAIPQWSLSRDHAITWFEATWYAETAISPNEALQDAGADGKAMAVANPCLVSSTTRTLLDIDPGRTDQGDEPFTLDCPSIRVGLDETENGLPRETTVQSRVQRLLDDLRASFGYGPQETLLTCRRTAVPKAAMPGQLLLVTADKLPNPGTNQRGGTRLVRVLEKNDVGATIPLRVLDLGPNAVLNAPTVGAISQEAGNTAGGVTFPITLNAQSDPVTVEVAATDTSVATVGAVPEVKWSRVYRLTASQTLTIRPLPSSSRIWVRARSETGGTSLAKIPSAWAYSTGTDYVDTAALTAPSGLATSAISSSGVTLTFTNTDTVFAVELLLESPSGDGLVSARLYPAGTTQITLVGLTAGATYGAAVRLNDGAGHWSASSSTVTWTATGTLPVAPMPLVLEVVGGLL